MTFTKLLVFALPVMAAEWIFFKIAYPYADFFTDSYSYIAAAAHRDAIGFRPIGYSLFLRLVHAASTSDTVLVTLQYVLVQGACLGLLGAMLRWCRLPKRAPRIMLAGMLLNPAIPYLCNYVSSDALFLGLSLIWLTVLMGLLREPSWWRMGLQLALLFMIFHLRFVALFYPAVAALSFLLLRRKGSAIYKLTGIAGSIAVVLVSTAWLKHISFRETGADTFSAFSGWQIANNVLNMYPYIPADTAELPTPQCRELATDVGAYFEKAGPGLRVARVAATTEYMWLRNSPLHAYMDSLQKRQRTDYFRAWNRVAPVFTQYSYYLIRRHPAAYIRYYGWPSMESFFLPPLDVFAVFNEGNKTIDPIGWTWFRYAQRHPRVWSATAQAGLLAPMPWICLLLYVSFTVTALGFLWSKRCRERYPTYTGCLELTAAYLLANALFSIFASPTVFRYQLLPMILLFVFTVGSAGILAERRTGEMT